MSAETSEPVKARVIAARLEGDTKLQISKDLGLSKPTVYKILSEAQVDRIAAETRCELISGTLGAAKRIVKDAKKNTGTAFEYLDRMGILTKRAESTGSNVNIGVNFEGLPGLK